MESSSQTSSVNRGYALAVFEYLERASLDPAAVCGADLVHEVKADPEGPRLSVAQWALVLAQAEQALQDPAFPVKLAATVRIRHLGMLGFLLMSCETLGDAALALQRYEQLLDGINEARFALEGDTCTLSWCALIDSPPRAFTMLSMALWAQFARWLSEQWSLACDADFDFPQPESDALVQALQTTFGGRLRFGMPCSAMRLPVALLALPVVHSDRHVHDALRQQAESDLLKLLGTKQGLLSHLEILLAERLESGQTSLEQVALILSMSPRTLQHRLDQYGLTYREVLDRVRCRQAERLLRNPRLPLAEVAGQLGFADQSGFQHAFKRWTGASPGEWRRRQVA